MTIYDWLCDFTGRSGAIRQAEFFIYRRSDRDALRGAQERHQAGAPIEPTTWIRATASDTALLAQLGIGETGMLASASDFHTYHKFTPGGRDVASEKYLDAVRRVLDAGIRPRLHLEDATRASIDFIRMLVDKTWCIAESYPERLRPKFRICDTLGVGLPDPDAMLPRSIPRIFQALGQSGLSPGDLEFHPHNDTWLVVANCLAAIRHGCGVINGTCLGKGERTGNAPLEAVLMHLEGMGYFPESRPNYPVLNQLAEFYESIGFPLAGQYPLYGRDAHRTRAGIHADGLNKFWWMYAPFDVPGLLGRNLEVSLTKESGLAGVLFVARQQTGREYQKHSPEIRAAAEWLQQEFDQGRQTAVEWEEIERFFPLPS